MKKLLSLVAAFVLTLVPSFAFAHEKWFVESVPEGAVKPELFSTWNVVSITAIVGAVITVIAAVIIHKKGGALPMVKRLQSALAKYSAKMPSIVRVFTGMILFIATLQGFLFAPDMKIGVFAPILGTIFLGVQLVVSLSLLSGIFVRIAAGMGALLYIAALFNFPIWIVLSYINYLGIFAYLLLITDSLSGQKSVPKQLHAFEKFALPSLRVTMGLSFVIVAVLYKILTPQFALEFVNSHEIVNFMPKLGITSFTNEMFVLAAGVTELTLGALLAAGILPGLIAAVLILLFTMTLGLFGLLELVGHLPLYAACFALIFVGPRQGQSAGK